MPQDQTQQHSRWTSKRFVFSILGLILATIMLATGHMTDVCWVYSLAIVLAGHHSVDLIKAWKGT